MDFHDVRLQWAEVGAGRRDGFANLTWVGRAVGIPIPPMS